MTFHDGVRHFEFYCSAYYTPYTLWQLCLDAKKRTHPYVTSILFYIYSHRRKCICCLFAMCFIIEMY